jgi:hypothetical protein
MTDLVVPIFSMLSHRSISSSETPLDDILKIRFQTILRREKRRTLLGCADNRDAEAQGGFRASTVGVSYGSGEGTLTP